MNKKMLYITTALMIVAAMAAGAFMLKQAEKMTSIARTKKNHSAVSLAHSGNSGITAVSAQKNGLMEISDQENAITIPEDSLYFKAERIARNPILKGHPKKYIGFKSKGRTFEWVVSLYDDKDPFTEDAALIVSDENNPDHIQSIKVKARGAGGVAPSLEDMFLFADVNFDGFEDLLVNTGSHGSQMAVKYYCFINMDGLGGKLYAESPEFTDILNPRIDNASKTIRSQFRENNEQYVKCEYRYENGKFVMIK